LQAKLIRSDQKLAGGELGLQPCRIEQSVTSYWFFPFLGT